MLNNLLDIHANKDVTPPVPRQGHELGTFEGEVVRLPSQCRSGVLSFCAGIHASNPDHLFGLLIIASVPDVLLDILNKRCLPESSAC